MNVIKPDPIETPVFGKAGMSREQVDGLKANITSQVPLGRIGRPEKVAAAVPYLVADATYVTGEKIVAGDGLVLLRR